MAAAWQVFCKELIDALRDRRTLLMVLLSSVAIGPLLLVALSALVADFEARAESREVFTVGIEAAPTLHNYLLRQAWTLQAAPADYPAAMVKRSFGHAVLVVPPGFEQELAAGRLSLERVLFVGEQILCALHAAHSVEVIHRDLKPSNVFIARGSGGSEVIKLLDFGLSRYQPVAFSSGTGAPALSMVAGTPEYVSPEQAIGSAPDTASDLYSFGAMLFELLTGRLPFEPGLELPNRVAALLHAHATERAPNTEQFDATVPTALGELVAQLLEKKPSARPSSAEEVRQRLENLRKDLAAVRPIQLVVRSPESIARMAMPPRRWRAAAALTAVMVFVPLAILLGAGSGSAAATPQLIQVPAPAVTAPAEVAELPPAPVERDEVPEVASVEPVAVPRRTRARAAPPVTAQSDCNPDARWRAAALSNLQELQQLAAQDHWAEFERLEPALANAVSAASTGAQCEAVERQIRKLARAWRP